MDEPALLSKHRQVSSVNSKIRVYAIALIILSIVFGGFSLRDYARYIPMRLGKPNCITLRDAPSMSLAKGITSCSVWAACYF